MGGCYTVILCKDTISALCVYMYIHSFLIESHFLTYVTFDASVIYSDYSDIYIRSILYVYNLISIQVTEQNLFSIT